jgi:hypothetical protein
LFRDVTLDLRLPDTLPPPNGYGLFRPDVLIEIEAVAATVASA